MFWAVTVGIWTLQFGIFKPAQNSSDKGSISVFSFVVYFFVSVAIDSTNYISFFSFVIWLQISLDKAHILVQIQIFLTGDLFS